MNIAYFEQVQPLTHVMPVVSFYTPPPQKKKNQKTKGFLFSGGIERV